MNWVGGSRNRCMARNDARKQREFFEKKKMQKRIENLGFAAGPQGAATGSIDLVTLFIVNQIAANKENKNSPKVTHLSQRKGGRWAMTENSLELPMSPCSPSRLCLMESQPQYSVLRKRKHHLSELPNNRLLSPVLESNFSDCSASDYRHVTSDTFSPLSSATSGSQSGTFPVGQSGEFKPFCQPRQVRDAKPWSTMSHRSQPKVHFPSVSRVQFGSTQSSFMTTQQSRRHATAGCFIGLSKDKMDQETALADFDSGEYSGQTTTFDNRKIRISFQEESQNSMSMGDPKVFQGRRQEADFLSQSVDSVASGGHGQGSVRSCGSVCSSPCEGLFSSGSDSVGSRGSEGDQFVPSHLQPATAHRKQAWAGQGRPCKSRETGTQTDCVSSRHTSDASTQCSPRKEGQVPISPGAGFPSHYRPASPEKHSRATRGQRVSADEPLEVDSHAGTPNSLKGERLHPQRKSVVAAQQNPRAALTAQEVLSGGPENLYRPMTMSENWRLSTYGHKHIYFNKTPVREELRKEQNGGQRQVELVEAPQPVENMTRAEGEDLMSEGTLMNKVSNETATLKEIADILLMMKQKNSSE